MPREKNDILEQLIVLFQKILMRKKTLAQVKNKKHKIKSGWSRDGTKVRKNKKCSFSGCGKRY